MDALTLLREQHEAADNQLTAVFKPVTPDVGAWTIPNWKANPITPIFLHAVSAGDNLVAGLSEKPSALDQGWREKIALPREWWTFTDKPQTELLLEYQAAVRKLVDAYLDSIKPDMLDQISETPRGPRTIAIRLSGPLVTHKFQHTGDISALLGCQGLQGLP